VVDPEIAQAALQSAGPGGWSGMERIAITGVTGFVGRGLAAMCKERGIAVTGVSRSGSGTVPGVDRWQTARNMDFRDCNAVINLAGEPVDRRWSAELKKRFRESRVDFTDRVVAAMAACAEGARPTVLVNASAVGIYGNRGDEELDESAPAAEGFLAELCVDWEAAAMAAEAHGIRVAVMRIGLVLGRDGRAWQKLKRVFHLGIGGRLGSGKQWMPWIHVDDMRAAIFHALDNPATRGPVNGAAPGAVRNADFTRLLAKSLGRPAVFPAPEFGLRLALGEFAGVLLASQRVVPRTLESGGFAFKYPTLEQALQELVKSTDPAR